MCSEALEYYGQLKSEQHREAWFYVIHVILERADSMSQSQVPPINCTTL